MTRFTVFLYQITCVVGVKKVVDLCAAPGSWSQVLARKIRYVSKHEIIPSSFRGILFYYHPPTKLRKGNVFSEVTKFYLLLLALVIELYIWINAKLNVVLFSKI